MKTTVNLERVVTYHYAGHKICRCVDNPKVPAGFVHVIIRQDFSIHVEDVSQETKSGANWLVGEPDSRHQNKEPEPPGEPDLFLSKFACIQCKTELGTYAIINMTDWKEGKFQVIKDSARVEYEKRRRAGEELEKKAGDSY